MIDRKPLRDCFVACTLGNDIEENVFVIACEALHRMVYRAKRDNLKIRVIREELLLSFLRIMNS